MNEQPTPKHPRYAAMLASITGGKFTDGGDAITAEEDYAAKSEALIKELEEELAAAKSNDPEFLERHGWMLASDHRKEVQRIESEVRAVNEMIGRQNVLIVCREGGGPEDIYGTLALSVMRAMYDLRDLRAKSSK